MSQLETLGPWTADDYERAALEYLRRLPLEHFMESTPQADQRRITLESFDLLNASRPDVHCFNELLVQYPFAGGNRQVVPDNMVVVGSLPDQARSSFNVPLEPARPLLVLEYVSASNPRKDYEDSFQKYESELHVPYCVLFHPARQDLRVYRHTGANYEPMELDVQGRRRIDVLDLELGLLDGWIRFWYRGQLLALPPELQQQLNEQSKTVRAQAKQLAERDKQLAERDKQLAALQTTLKEHEARSEQHLQERAQAIALLRTLVEARARERGRADILAALPTVNELEPLQRWLLELTP